MSTPIIELMPHLHARAWNVLTREWQRTIPEFATVEQVAATSDADLLELRHMGPKMLAEVREAVQKTLSLPPPPHEPRRGSDVEAWIKARRDEHAGPDGKPVQYDAWTALDSLLDDYRDHADCGVPLSEEIEGPNA